MTKISDTRFDQVVQRQATADRNWWVWKFQQWVVAIEVIYNSRFARFYRLGQSVYIDPQQAAEVAPAHSTGFIVSIDDPTSRYTRGTDVIGVVFPGHIPDTVNLKPDELKFEAHQRIKIGQPSW